LERLPAGRRTEEIYQRGKRLVSLEWVIIFLSNPDEDEVRIAVHTGKRFGKATERNRIRRQAREALRTIRFNASSLDVIVIPRSMVKGRKFSEILNQLDLLFKKLGKMNSK
jgi:ribonuclease P protein component